MFTHAEYSDSLHNKPDLLNLSDFNLTITGPDGRSIPYLGLIEVTVKADFMQGKEVEVLALIMPNTEYNRQVPIIVGTNVIRCYQALYSVDSEESDIPPQWKAAFMAIQDDHAGTVRSTNKSPIEIQPMETITVSGLVRKQKNVDSAVTEPTDRASSKLGICPRVVALNKPGKNARVPIRIFNMSAKVLTLQPKSLLCQLHEVKVLRSCTPETKSDNVAWTQQHTASCNIDDETEFNLSDIGVDLSNSKLTEDQKVRAAEVFQKWQDIFSRGPTDLGHTDLVQHEIKLTDEKPFKEPFRRISPALIDEVREHINEMLAAEAIRPSQSPFSSNVVIVRKKDGTIRFCIDFRKLNQRTINDAYAIPRIEDSLHLLAGSKFFTKLDLKAGYWQVELKEEDKAKTAFQVGNIGFYECNRMPFGLCNAPATFQRLMERAMGELNLKDCLIYLDDIIIFSESFDQHLERLEAVFKRLHEHNLKLKASKCEFFMSEVTYLGHVVSEEGIKTDPDKIKALKGWPTPKSIKDVRKFLGFAGYYRRFCKGFSAIVRPLNDLLVGQSTSKPTKKTVFKWEEPQQTAFKTIIDRLSNPPILGYADYRMPFKLHTDASGNGLGAVLYQHQDGLDRVIAYASRSLKPAERNYPAHKLEFLALKWAITDKFHDYLYGAKFDVFTDNNPLTYILSTARLDATGHRWVAALSNYNFTLTYRSGKLNKDADALSRLPEATEAQPIIYPDVLKAIMHTSQVATEERPLAEAVLITQTVESDAASQIPDERLQASALKATDWIKGQDSDPVLSRLKYLVIGGKKPTKTEASGELPDVRKYLRDWDKLVLKDGVLYRQTHLYDQEFDQILVPTSAKRIVLTVMHDGMGHQGRDRTSYLVKTRFFWLGMDTDIVGKVRQCTRCILRKTRPVPAAELVNITSSYPMELVCIDYLKLETSKGGYEDVLVITDHFTRYAQAIPTRNQTAHTTARALFEHFFVHYGFPSRLHSDKAQNFESKVIRHLCKVAGIRKSRTTPYHPMGNGQVERFNQTLIRMLGTLEPPLKSNWKSYVSPLVHAYNATRHDSTGFSPFFLMFGRHPRLAVDAFFGLDNSRETPRNQAEYVHKLQSRLKLAYRKAAEEAGKRAEVHKFHYDRGVRENKLVEGDCVLIKKVGFEGRHKLADVWEEEPHIVLRQPNPEIPVFDVQQVDGRGRVKTLHRNELLPFNSIPVEELQKEQRETEMGLGSDPEPTAPDLLESETSSKSSSSSSEDDEDGKEDESAHYLPTERLPGELSLQPRTRVRSKPANRPQRQRKPPGWLTTGNWVT